MNNSLMITAVKILIEALVGTNADKLTGTFTVGEKKYKLTFKEIK